MLFYGIYTTVMTGQYPISHTEDYLLHPELFRAVPALSEKIADKLTQRVGETLVDDLADDADMSIVVRTYNEKQGLEQLFEDLHHQRFAKEVEVIVVDSESTDNTPEVARYYGAEVVPLRQADFTYPYSLNKGVEAASHDNVFLTVGHATLSNIYNLHGGVRHFKDSDVAGAFGTTLTNANASRTENLTYGIGNLYIVSKPAFKIKKAGMGVLGATNAMISKSAWEELGGFDERYAAGGEDTALANLMLNAGYTIVKEPALSVHHTHGLGPRDSIKQYLHWREILKGPHGFDKAALLARRPDMQAKTQ